MINTKDSTKFVKTKNIQIKILHLKNSSSCSTPFGYGRVNGPIFTVTKFPGADVKRNVRCRFENSDEKFTKVLEVLNG